MGMGQVPGGITVSPIIDPADAVVPEYVHDWRILSLNGLRAG